MPYPILSRDAAQLLANQLLELRDSDADPIDELLNEEEAGVERRPGPECQLEKLAGHAIELREELVPGVTGNAIWEATPSLDEKIALEAAMAGPIHEILSSLPAGVIHDYDFWRYLALFPFRWYLLAREPNLKPASFGGFAEEVDDQGDLTGGKLGTGMKYQLLVRTYLWGRAAYDPTAEEGESYERSLALSIEDQAVIDFWHSHIIRPQIGYLDPLPHAFIDATVENELTKGEARELAKMLTRLKNTVVFDVLDPDEAADLVAEQLDLAKQRLSAQ